MDRGEEKRRLRQWVREQQKAVPPEALAEAALIIEKKVLALPAYRDAGTILAFISMPGEPETRGIIQDAVRRGKRVLLPRCVDHERMEMAPFTGPERLIPGRWKIPEPEPADASALPLPEPDLILVPCMAATRNGRRLGHGAGYYDRFLKNRPGWKVCLCFDAFLLENLPTDENDICMDCVLSEGD